MGTFSVGLWVGNIFTDANTTVSALVDTGATNSMLPASLLNELGIEPVEVRTARIADGRRVEFHTAWARFSKGGRNAVSRVAFGPEGEYLLGATTLGDLGMVVDPVDQRLIVQDDLLMSGETIMEFANKDVVAAGRKIYEGIREEMEANHWGKLVVIDIHSGDYEVGEFVSRRSDFEITKRLRRRRPDAYTWAVLVGYGAPYYREPNRPGLIPVVPEKKPADD